MTHWKTRLAVFTYITVCAAMSDTPVESVTLPEWIALACVWIACERAVVGVVRSMEAKA